MLNNQVAVLQQIAEASKLQVPVMLTEGNSAAAILAFLYMRPTAERTTGLAVFMNCVNTGAAGGNAVTIYAILNSVKVPLIYTLALELGDDDPTVQAQVRPHSRRLRTYFLDLTTLLRRPSGPCKKSRGCGFRQPTRSTSPSS